MINPKAVICIVIMTSIECFGLAIRDKIASFIPEYHFGFIIGVISTALWMAWLLGGF